MNPQHILKIFLVLLFGLMGCEPIEEEDGKNNPENLVGKWIGKSIQVGFEITTNSDQEFVDLSKAGIGSGISISGNNQNENLQYINPMFMMGPDDENGGGNNDGPDFLFAAQNLDWAALRNPQDLIGQTLKMFVLMEDYERIHRNDGTEKDTMVNRGAYFQWVINDSSNFFMGDRPPDSLYLADRVNPSDFTMDTTNHKLTLNDLSLYFATFIQLPNDRDSLSWDSSRVTIASGDLMPATITIPSNTPTILATPFMEEEMIEGPPEEIDLMDDGTMEMKDTFLDCDDDGNCNPVTEHLSGEWWTEGPDTLILAITESSGFLDTVDLQYVVTANDLKVIHREDPCEDDEWNSEHECMTEISRGFIGLNPNSITSLEIIMNLAFDKSTTTRAAPSNLMNASKVNFNPVWLKQIRNKY